MRLLKGVVLITIGFGIGLVIMAGLLDLDMRAWIYGPTPPPRLPVGKIDATSGQVETRFTSTGSWDALKDGQTLAARDEVRTGPSSSAGATFREGGAFVIGEFSHVTFDGDADELGRLQAMQVSYLTGSVRLESKPEPNVPLELEIPGKISATQIPGGRLVIVESEDGRALMSFMGAPGKVRANERDIPVPDGYGIVIRAGELLTDPIPLPQPPVRVSSAQGSFRFRERKPVRVVVARDEKMLDVAAELDGENGRAKIDTLPAGNYYAMAATRDETTGLLGPFSDTFRITIP